MLCVAKRPWLLPLVAVLLCGALYMQTLGYDFVYDDFPLIVENPIIRNLGNIPRMLFMEDIVDGIRAGYYRPLTPAFDAIIYAAFGPSPAAFHLGSILYHLITVVLVFYLIRTILKDDIAAFVGTLFFGLHPVLTESVAFISARNNILSGMFSLAAVLSFLRYREHRRHGWLMLSVLLYLVGMGTKEFALMVPFVIAVIEVARGGFTKKHLQAYLPLLGALVIYLAMRSYVVKGFFGQEIDAGSLVQRLTAMADVLVTYTRLALLPFGQKALYHITLVPDLKTVLSGLVLAAAAYAAIKWRHKQWVPISVLWFYLFFAPVSNVIPISGAAMAERFMYVPMAGAALFAGGLYHEARGGRFKIAAAALVLIALTVMTLARMPVWKSDEALYSDMIRTTPSAYKGHYNLGNLRYKQGRLQEAATHWTRAIQVRPDMFAIHNNLGILHEQTGSYALAEQHFRTVLSVRAMPEVHANLGAVLKKQRKYAEAIESYERAIAMSSGNAEFYVSLSEVYEDQGDIREALRTLERAMRAAPAAHLPHLRTGAILGSLTRYSEAERHFQEALTRSPGCAECSYNLDLVRTLRAQGAQ